MNNKLQIIRDIEDSTLLSSLSIMDMVKEHLSMFKASKDPWYDPQEEYAEHQQRAQRKTWTELLPILMKVQQQYHQYYPHDYCYIVYTIQHKNNKAGGTKVSQDVDVGVESDVVLLIEEMIEKHGYNMLVDFYEKGIIVTILCRNNRHVLVQHVLKIVHPYEEMI